MRLLLVGGRFHPHFKTINTPKAHASTKAVTVMDDLDVGTLYQQGRWKEALLILQVKDISVERWTYIYMLQGCIERKALSEGKRIHAHMNQRGEFMADTFLSNTLLNMYIKCGSVVDARRIFDQMAERERDVCSWTAMIAAYSRHGPAQEARACTGGTGALLQNEVVGRSAESIHVFQCSSRMCQPGVSGAGYRDSL